MRFSINGRVFPYILRSSILSILFALISSILGPGWFFLFLGSFALIPIFLYLFREKKSKISHENRCLSPCDGILYSVTDTEKYHYLTFIGGLIDAYGKKSPITGEITNITSNDDKQNISIDIKNHDGLFTLEVINTTKIKSKIDILVNIGDKINQGDDVCFVEFGSKINLYIPKKLTIIVNKDSEIISGVTNLAV
jgi:hypothetical protein